MPVIQYDKKQGPIGRLEITHPALQNVPVPSEDKYSIGDRLVDIDVVEIERRILDNYSQAKQDTFNHDK